MCRIVWISFVTVLFLVVGCSDTPVITPSENQDYVTSGREAVSINSSRYLWGFWEVLVDPGNHDVQVIPRRSTAMHLNMVLMMEQVLCQDCIKIGNFNFIPPDQLSVDLTLKHPIQDNLNLTGFDVRGIFISTADYTFPTNNRNISLGGAFPMLVNPDGYTSLFNPSEYPEDSPAGPLFKYVKTRSPASRPQKPTNIPEQFRSVAGFINNFQRASQYNSSTLIYQRSRQRSG